MNGKIDPSGLTSAFFDSWRQLGADERRVVVALAQRLVIGRSTYGEWKARADQRDHQEEAAAEALDLSVYLAMRLVSRGEKGGKDE
jgi:hypothetical protein